MDDDLVEQPVLAAPLGKPGRRMPTFLPAAARVARTTADSMSSLMNVPVIPDGTADGGLWLRTKYGPVRAPT